MEKKPDVKLDIKAMTVGELESCIGSMNQDELQQAGSIIRLLSDKVRNRQKAIKMISHKHF